MKTYTEEQKKQLIEEILRGIHDSPRGFLQVTIKKKEKKYLIDFINSCSPTIISKFSIPTKINWILNNRKNFPTCKVCGKPFKKNVSALGKYQTYCSIKCEKNDIDNIEKCRKTYNSNFPTVEDKEKIKLRARKTCLEKYGNETYRNPNQNRLTKLEKYGDENYNNRDKAKTTCLEKYGVDNPTYLESVKLKSKQTKFERYGDENYVNHEKFKLTCLEKYGTITPLANKECREKGKQTCLEKYGSEHFMKTDKGITKVAETKLERYGDKNFNNSEKNKETCLKRYGVEHPLQLKTFRDKCKSKYFYNEQYFDSSWELAYYIWLSDMNKTFVYHPNISFEYEVIENDEIKLHKYFPDFLVENKIIEIKGDDQIKDETMIDKIDSKKNKIADAKYKCMQKNNVSILLSSDIKPYLKYVSNKYGSNYLSKFRVSSMKGKENAS